MSEEVVKKKMGRPRGSKTREKPETVSAANNQEVAEKVVRKKQKPNHQLGLTNFGAENVNPGDNSTYLRYAMASLSLPPIDISDPKQVEKRVWDYFEFCIQNDRKPNMVGMANWLGVSRDCLNDWRRGNFRLNTHSEIIRKACLIMEELWHDYMMNGKVNPASGIFLGKNMYGYRDVQDVVVTPNNPLGDAEQAPALAQKYVDAIEQDGEEYLLPGDAPVNAQNGSVGVLEGEAEKIYTE